MSISIVESNGSGLLGSRHWWILTSSCCHGAVGKYLAVCSAAMPIWMYLYGSGTVCSYFCVCLYAVYQFSVRLVGFLHSMLTVGMPFMWRIMSLRICSSPL